MKARGVARISMATHQIVVSFSPPVVSCLLKKGLHKMGTGSPQDTPATPLKGHKNDGKYYDDPYNVPRHNSIPARIMVVVSSR